MGSREKAFAAFLLVGLLPIVGTLFAGGISLAASPFPKTSSGHAAPYQSRDPLFSLRRAVERAALQYARNGMENPIRYDRVYRRYQNAETRYYSDTGPGGRSLQRWLRRQSIYSGPAGGARSRYLRRTPGL